MLTDRDFALTALFADATSCTILMTKSVPRAVAASRELISHVKEREAATMTAVFSNFGYEF
jgi:hypothetical protein